MMTNADKLREFHKRHFFPVELDLAARYTPERDDEIATDILNCATRHLASLASYIEKALVNNKDVRLVRAQLGIEEMGELIHALARRDALDLLDALADVQYITEGTAITYGMPLQEAFDVVHASNMSKAVRNTEDPRLRNKGDSYIPATAGLKQLLPVKMSP